MQKKLFRIIMLLVTVSLVMFAGIVVFVCYNIYRSSTYSDLKVSAAVAVVSEKSPEEIAENLDEACDFKLRVTFVDSTGRVVFDNENDVSEMENHMNRQEIRDAFEKGSGESERISKTLDTTYCFYAVRYHDGVLRLGRSRSSIIAIAGSVLIGFAFAIGIIIIVTMIVSIKLSERVMKPVHELVRRFDISGGEGSANEIPETEIYEELEPVAQTADRLLDETHAVFNRLKKEKEKFVLITENMAEGMILLDSDETVLSVNRTALKIFSCDEIPADKKLRLSQLTEEPQLSELLHALESSSSARGIIKINDRFWSTFVNKSEYAGSYGIVIILADVTENIKSEEIRRDFSANVSHELKTPLTTIKGFGEMIENGIFSDTDDVKKYGGMIYRESERLLSLINDIMRLSEIEDENIKTNMEKVNLAEILEDCEEILQDKAVKHDISLEIKGDDVSVMAERSYITELFLNLIDNSIKYNIAGGRVIAEVRTAENGAEVVVEDSGIGISEADQARVFERFYRVDKSRSKETGGTGLGLSIVKHIVALHGGRVSISSRLGEGTRITVFLPYGYEE